MTVAEAIQGRYPTAIPLRDYEVTVGADGVQRITRWDPALGPVPTSADLATVTDADVAAGRALRHAAAAGAAAVAGSDPASVAIRDLYALVNDLRARAGLPVADPADIANRPPAPLPAADPMSPLIGTGVPSDAVGVNGSTYINVTTGAVYTKQNGTWF